ncbi:hypothetical protein ACFYXM_12180 [Streptomyces sp. NPDC002476]|uniref:hypothetical protein n=1 Tax=Streptomyces sp. NPDC002476 TaxID=3364648 RepID=UPI0036C0FB80
MDRCHQPPRTEHLDRLESFTLAAGARVALTGLVLEGGRYHTVVPTLYGVWDLLPVLSGVAAVIPLWRQHT